MSYLEHDWVKRGRGVALLLAFLFGIVTGGASAMTPVQARPLAASIVRDVQLAVAITAKSGAAALQVQRATPDPILLPDLPAEICRAVLRRVERPEGRAPLAMAATAITAYRARAPPAL